MDIAQKLRDLGAFPTPNEPWAIYNRNHLNPITLQLTEHGERFDTLEKVKEYIAFEVLEDPCESDLLSYFDIFSAHKCNVVKLDNDGKTIVPYKFEPIFKYMHLAVYPEK